MMTKDRQRQPVGAEAVAGFFLILGSSLTIGCLTGGCVTGGGNTPVVIERSKQDAPAWVDLQQGALTVNGGFFRYIESKDHILNLPLGIKQTQLSALHASKIAVGQHAKVLSTDLLGSRGGALPQTELFEHLEKATAEVHAEQAKVADIYFERYSHQGAEDATLSSYYRASVLVEFPRHGLKSIFRVASASLQKSGRAELRQVGDWLKPLGESLPGH